MRALVVVLAVAAAVAFAAAALRGVGPLGWDPAGPARDVAGSDERRARDPARAAAEDVREAGRRAPGGVGGRAAAPRARCPAGVAGCAAARGLVVLVERVDPDGDGDLHVVIADGSVTAPGLTAVDVRPALRPARDPRIGDLAAAAGPVQRGSHGQAQIHALAFRTARGG